MCLLCHVHANVTVSHTSVPEMGGVTTMAAHLYVGIRYGQMKAGRVVGQ